MQVYNNTPWTLTSIENECSFLGVTVNAWRQRTIRLYTHPFDEALLVSVGTAFDGSMQVIAAEARAAYTEALTAIAYGRIYTSQ